MAWTENFLSLVNASGNTLIRDLSEATFEMKSSRDLSPLPLQKSYSEKKYEAGKNGEDLSNHYFSEITILLRKCSENNLILDPKMKDKLINLMNSLRENPVSVKVIRSHCFEGLPDICKRLRPICWRILLNYFPSDRGKWSEITKKNKDVYESYIQEYMQLKGSKTEKEKPQVAVESPHMVSEDKSQPVQVISFVAARDHPLSRDKKSSWNSFFVDQGLWDEIEKDTRRTRKDMEFFKKDKDKLDSYPSFSKNRGQSEKLESVSEILCRILFIYAKKNPELKYIQGMNEILAPIYYTLATDENPYLKNIAEPEAFVCFSLLMNDLKDSFLHYSSTPAGEEFDGGRTINTRIKNYVELLKKIDVKLWQHLAEYKINPQFYCLKWMLLLFSQEFPLPDVMSLWDTLLSHPNKIEYVNYIAISILSSMREKLTNGDFSTIMSDLQNISRNVELSKVLIVANNLYNEYSGSKD